MSKRNIILIIFFIIAVILLFYANKKENEQKNSHNYIFKNLDFDKITEIKINNFTLKKKNNEWYINSIKCNKYKIEFLINYLKDIDFKTIISNNKENFKNFNVDDKKALKVKIKTSNGKIYKLWIGKYTPDGNGCYVRLEDNNVYLIPKNLVFEFDKKGKYFYLEKQSNKQ